MVRTGPRGTKYGHVWWPRSPEGGWLAGRSRGNRGGACARGKSTVEGPTRHRDQGTQAGGRPTDRAYVQARANRLTTGPHLSPRENSAARGIPARAGNGPSGLIPGVLAHATC
jgi:hypothetical protein